MPRRGPRPIRCLHALTVLTITLLVCGPGSAAAQPEEFRATLSITSDDQPASSVVVSAAAGQTRMDMAGDEQVSIVVREDGGLMVIQHAERRYLEFDPEQLNTMRQLMSRLQQTRPPVDELDVERLRFSETGRTETIGAWDAFEVHVTMDDGAADDEMYLWISNDPPVGLMEVGRRMAESASALAGPLAQGPAGITRQFGQFEALTAASGLPEGRIVRILTNTDGNSSTITLDDVSAGALAGDTFDAPDGYEPMQVPSIPGLPE